MQQSLAKGHLNSKCLFVVFNSSKNEPKQLDLRYQIIIVLKLNFFVWFFWDNQRNRKDVSKLTDLYEGGKDVIAIMHEMQN